MEKLLIGLLAFNLPCLGMASHPTLPQQQMTKNENTSAQQDWRNLTPEESRVIAEKGTERAFTGKYNKHMIEGVYTCRQCETALYRSEDKFDSTCGWPAFDNEIPEAVKRTRDADGQRIEITCARCGGHLGHVFEGERLTKRNVRHCVNSISMDFVPVENFNKHFERAIFAGGCFWGVEYFLQQARGVITAVSGYTGGRTENPKYQEVCAGKTGHIEAVEVLYDPKWTDYETLTRLFFEIHDPTQRHGQGGDIGEQYLSMIFYRNDTQKATAEKLIALLQKRGLDIATQLRPVAKFYPAESLHQDYYFRNGKLPYCHFRTKRFD